MATQTVDSHQTCTSDEQTVKLSSEAVKVKEQINLSSPQETVEDDREKKGKADDLHIPESTLSTSEEKAVDIIHAEPPVIEVKKTDETPVLDLPVHDNLKLEKESTYVAEVATEANETVPEESPSTEPVGEEATELPVIAYLEKSIKEFDATDNVKSPPEEQPTAQVIEPAAASAKKVEEQPSKAGGLPNSEDVSSGNNVEPGASVQSVIELAEKVEIVSVSVEEVEEKKPKIIDNPELSAVADSGKGSAEAEEEPTTKCVSVEKEPDKKPETGVPEESVVQPKQEVLPIELDSVEEPIEVVAKDIIKETVEPTAEKEQPVEVHPIKGLEEVITKEISEPIEVTKEKKQTSEVEPGQELREVIETKISGTVEVPQESELLVEKEQAVIDKETNEYIEPLKNTEQLDEVIYQKESVEVKAQEATFEPPKNNEYAEEGLSVTESGEGKEKETNDSTLDSEEIEKQEKKVIEVKDGIRELPEVTKHVQDTYVEAATVEDEKPLAHGDDIGPPIEEKIKEEGSDEQDSVGQVAESGPIENFVKELENKQPVTEFVTLKREPKEEPETTSVPEKSVEPPKKEEQPSEVVPAKEPAEVVAKEVTETVAPLTEKEQPVEEAKEISEVVPKEAIVTVDPLTEQEQPIGIAEAISEVVAKEVIKTVEPATENEQPVEIAKETNESIEPLKNQEQPDEQEVSASFDPPKNNKQVDEGFLMTESSKRLEEEHPAQELVNVDKETTEELTTTPVSDLSVEAPKKEERSIEVLTMEEQMEVVTKEIIETTEPPTEKEQPVVIATETSESIDPLKDKEQPDELVSQKESIEVIAEEVSASSDPLKNNKQVDEDFSMIESSKRLEVEHPAQELVNVDKETTEELATTPVSDFSVEPPKKEEPLIEVLTVEEQVEVITKEIIETTKSSIGKEQSTEVHPLKELEEMTETETTESIELPKKKEEIDNHPVQESREVIAEKISEAAEMTKENESLTEVHPVKELEFIADSTSESIEPPMNDEQPNVLFHKESLQVIAKEVSASFEPPKYKDKADEGFPVAESGEGKEKEISDSTMGFEEVVKQEPEDIKIKESVTELPKLTKHVEATYVEVETVKDEKALTTGDDINPLIEGGKIQEEEAQCTVESDKQVSEGQVAKSDLIEDSGKGIEKEQPAEEFVNLDKEPRKKLETTCVPELFVKPPKKEEPIEERPAEQIEVIEKEIIEAVELSTEKEQPTGVHPPKGSEEVVEKEIVTEQTELHTKKEHATEEQLIQESKEVIAKKISDSVEIPKENELLIEAQAVKELEVVSEDTTESTEVPRNQEQPNEVPLEKESEVIAKEISESFEPPKNTEKADEGLSLTETEEVRAKETRDSKLGPEEVEKRELEATEVKDNKDELTEVTNHVPNEFVKVEIEAFEKDESVKGEKSLALGDDSMPHLEVEQIHKEEEQCTVENYEQDSLNQGAQPSIELAAGDFSPQDVKEDEKKDSSNIIMVSKPSEVEATVLEKVGEENEEKMVKTDKSDEDKYEKIPELTLSREEMSPRGCETDVVVIEKPTGDQNAGEVVDLIAESKTEESTTNEKPAVVETSNDHVNETPKEPKEPELEVKDKETVITGGEVPKVNDKKEVPSKPGHKHSNNILSKVKQSLVKAKKAIIGKSPSSKTLSSEAKDDIKVK